MTLYCDKKDVGATSSIADASFMNAMLILCKVDSILERIAVMFIEK